MFDSVLRMSLSLQPLSNLYSNLMLCTASGTFRILEYSQLYFVKYIEVCSNILNINKAYLGIVNAHSGLFRTMYNPHISTTLSYSGKFKTGGIFRTLWNIDQAYSEPCHSQNSLLRHCSTIFRHIVNLHITICNSHMSRNLAYLEF